MGLLESYKPPWEIEKSGARFLQARVEKQRTQVGTWEILLRYNYLIHLFFYHMGGQILEQGLREAVGSAVLGDAWNSAGLKPSCILTGFKGKVELEVPCNKRQLGESR